MRKGESLAAAMSSSPQALDDCNHDDIVEDSGGDDDDDDDDAANAIMSDSRSHTPLFAKSSVKDAQRVKGARIVVLVVLLLSAVTIASLAYFILLINEQQSFKAQFESSARQVLLMANHNMDNVLLGFHTLAAVYPTTAKMSNVTTLPFITLDGFDTLAAGIALASSVTFSPLLETPHDLQKWNEYVPLHASLWTTNDIVPFVYTLDANASIVPRTAADTGPYGPLWQTSSVSTQSTVLINFDAFASTSSMRQSMEYVVRTGLPNLVELTDDISIFGTATVNAGPMLLLHQPVFNDVMDAPNKRVIGFLTGLLPWKHFFKNVVAQGHDNVMVVVEGCDSNITSTFVIDGAEATFVGMSDLHDAKYNAMQQSESLVASPMNVSSSANQQCPFIVHVYPTAQLEARYKTDTPLYYALDILFIFAFSALVFIWYDYFVTTRQRRTKEQADKSNAIVQEMFPGEIAQRLYAGNAAGGGGTSHNVSSKAASLGLSGFGKVDRSTIAKLHPEATILFADIAGFTAWSSTRDPHQVFTLLESLFQSFDALAKKFDIFKVETIGDCYVAACGVPNVNAEHAVVMSRFARSMMVKFRWVCRSLELTLGPDTGGLALRVGMHSGPVTAGVLRGERARFQLFGDTVNTASRMESTGVRERVHISEETALQLISHGKNDWIVLRDDVVEAKGKGKLVTYWLQLSTRDRAMESVVDSGEAGDVDAVSHHARRNNGKSENVETRTSP